MKRLQPGFSDSTPKSGKWSISYWRDVWIIGHILTCIIFSAGFSGLSSSISSDFLGDKKAEGNEEGEKPEENEGDFFSSAFSTAASTYTKVSQKTAFLHIYQQKVGTYGSTLYFYCNPKLLINIKIFQLSRNLSLSIALSVYLSKAHMLSIYLSIYLSRLVRLPLRTRRWSRTLSPRPPCWPSSTRSRQTSSNPR